MQVETFKKEPGDNSIILASLVPVVLVLVIGTVIGREADIGLRGLESGNLTSL